MQLIDVNVWLDYPLPGYEAEGGPAAERLRQLAAMGIIECWAGSFAALFAPDPEPANRELIATCAGWQRPRVRPAVTVNPTLPELDRRFADLARAGVRIVRLYPPAHGYDLADEPFWQAVTLAAKQRMVVQVVCSVEDRRTQPPSVNWPLVDPTPLKAAAARLAAPVVLLNCPARRYGDLLPGVRNVFVDTAMQEGAGVLARLIEQIGATRLLFGSYSPVFYTASNLLKLIESPLPERHLRAIAYHNARRLLQSQ